MPPAELGSPPGPRSSCEQPADGRCTTGLWEHVVNQLADQYMVESSANSRGSGTMLKVPPRPGRRWVGAAVDATGSRRGLPTTTGMTGTDAVVPGSTTTGSDVAQCTRPLPGNSFCEETVSGATGSYRPATTPVAATTASIDAEAALATALVEFSSIASGAWGQYRRRVAAAQHLFEAIVDAAAGESPPTRTGEAAVRVLFVEMQRILRSLAARRNTKGAEGKGEEKIECVRTLSAMRSRVLAHARITYGLVLGRASHGLNPGRCRRARCDTNADSLVEAGPRRAPASPATSTCRSWVWPSGVVQGCRATYDITSPRCTVNLDGKASPPFAADNAMAQDSAAPPIRSHGTHDSQLYTRDIVTHTAPRTASGSVCVEGADSGERLGNSVAIADMTTAAGDATAVAPDNFNTSLPLQEGHQAKFVGRELLRASPIRVRKRKPFRLWATRQLSHKRRRGGEQSGDLQSVVPGGAECGPIPSTTLDTPKCTLAETLAGFCTAVQSNGTYSAHLDASLRLLDVCVSLPVPSPEGETAVCKFWIELQRVLTNIGCRIHEKRDVTERLQIRKQLVEVRRKLRAYARSVYQLDLGTINPRPVACPGPEDKEKVPASLEELRRRCETYRSTGSCLHLCRFLCYFREYDPVRQLQALHRRARSHPLHPSVLGWTARLAIAHQPPYWCTVFHDSCGAVLGSPKQAYQAAIDAALAAPLRSRTNTAVEPSLPFLPTLSTKLEKGRSPFGLIEDLLADNPWQLLIACVLLNKTGRVLVDRLLATVFQRWPTAEALREADRSELEQMLTPLGLQRKRSFMLRRFSHEYLAAVSECGSPLPADRLRALHGLGKYAIDAYEIYVRQAVDKVHPTDIYLGWAIEYFRSNSTG